jgi:hypothetical protein
MMQAKYPDKEYAGIGGIPEFIKVTGELAFGTDGMEILQRVCMF